MKPQTSLNLIKLIHTVAWAFFAGCILAIPLFTWQGDLKTASFLIGIVFIEVFIILFNQWRCPLTDVAARYTENRADNFDIYLPLWLARYNKVIFGTLFFLGLLYTLFIWIV